MTVTNIESFWKMHGNGNDFVVVFDPEDRMDISPEAVRKLCDRHFGIGADGVIRIGSGGEIPYFMDYRNADGSVSEMCANGVRVTGKYLGDRGLVGDEFSLQTRAGAKILTLDRSDGVVKTVLVDMGQPVRGAQDVDVVAGDRTFRADKVSMGNPHAIIFENPDRDTLLQYGSFLEHHQEFPDRANITFVTVSAPDVLTARVWERGSGETLCCGSAACAMSVAAMARDMVGETVRVDLPGGPLIIQWRPGESVMMQGPATEVFQGRFDPAEWGVTLR